MKAVVAAFNQEKALVGAFSGITNLRMELFEALVGGGSGNVYNGPTGSVIVLMFAADHIRSHASLNSEHWV